MAVPLPSAWMAALVVATVQLPAYANVRPAMRASRVQHQPARQAARQQSNFNLSNYLSKLKLLCWGDFPEQLSEEDFAHELQGGLGCSDIVLGGIT